MCWHQKREGFNIAPLPAPRQEGVFYRDSGTVGKRLLGKRVTTRGPWKPVGDFYANRAAKEGAEGVMVADSEGDCTADGVDYHRPEAYPEGLLTEKKVGMGLDRSG